MVFYMRKKEVLIKVKDESLKINFDKEKYFFGDSITINFEIMEGYELLLLNYNENYINEDKKLFFEKYEQEVLLLDFAYVGISNLPIMKISVDNQEINSKVDYVEGNLTLENSNFTDYENVKMGIRRRGNFTYEAPKKPYRIKFDDKISLMGSKEEKSFVLLADWYDQSGLRNYFGYTFASKVLTDQFSPMAHHIHLFIDGNYMGLYLLTDQINESRVDIKEKKLGKKDEVPFLLEIDLRAPHEKILDVDYFVVDNLNYVIKYPSRDDGLKDNQFLYIKNYIENLNERIKNNNNYEELLDVDSFINYFLVMEYVGNKDLNELSVYLYKEKNSKIKFGPIWDLDISLDNYLFENNAEIWISSINWFSILIKNDEFKEKFKNRWDEVSNIIDNHIMEIKLYKDKIFDALNYSFYQWKEIRKASIYFDVYDDYDVDFNKILAYLSKRKAWISQQLN